MREVVRWRAQSRAIPYRRNAKAGIRAVGNRKTYIASSNLGDAGRKKDTQDWTHTPPNVPVCSRMDATSSIVPRQPAKRHRSCDVRCLNTTRMQQIVYDCPRPRRPSTSPEARQGLQLRMYTLIFDNWNRSGAIAGRVLNERAS